MLGLLHDRPWSYTHNRWKCD